MTVGVQVTIAPATGRFDAEDQRWLDQVVALVTDLRKEVGGVAQRRLPQPDTKGAVSEVILALSSAGAVTAAVECFRAWLGKDKTRALTVTWPRDDGTEQTVTVTGDGIDQASFQALAEAIARRLGS